MSWCGVVCVGGGYACQRYMQAAQSSGVVPFTFCFDCLQNTPAMRCCCHCGNLLRAVTSTKPQVQATYQSTYSRLTELLERSNQRATVERHSAELDNFETFCATHLDIRAVVAHPIHVVAYLMHSDSNGRTVVHDQSCPAARPDSQGTACAGTCPTRLKGSSVRVKLSALRAAFDELGATKAWRGGHRPSENPARSSLVTLYEVAVNKEQLAAGVVTTRAPILDLPVVQALVQHYLQLAIEADAGGDDAAGWWCTQCAFLVAFLFTYTDRGHNCLALHWGDVAYVAPPAGAPHARASLRVTIRITKSSRASMSERSVTMVDTDDVVTPVRLYLDLRCRVLAASPLSEAQLRNTFLFLPKKRGVGTTALQGGAGSGTLHLPRRTVDSVLAAGLAAVGLTHTSVTLHSFRASGADYALAQPGADVAEILREYH